MKKIIKNKVLILVLLLLLSSSISQIKANGKYISQDINNLSYKQEIRIPIDTSKEIAKFQPIDLKVDFSNSCWAIDENHHSVRVGIDDGSDIFEIESQIYDLEFIDDTHIKSCNIVFILPEKANGKEKYYIFYE